MKKYCLCFFHFFPLSTFVWASFSLSFERKKSKATHRVLNFCLKLYQWKFFKALWWLTIFDTSVIIIFIHYLKPIKFNLKRCFYYINITSSKHFYLSEGRFNRIRCYCKPFLKRHILQNTSKLNTITIHKTNQETEFCFW